MVFNKKAISPVVATALLLVVAVVAVVGFQTWFNTYQSGLNVKVEQESATGSAITVERLEVTGTNATVYIKNGDTANAIPWTSIKAGTCTNTTGGSFAKSSVTSVITKGGCAPTAGSAYDVVVVTSSGVYSAKLIAR